jgi:hypothetical protein
MVAQKFVLDDIEPQILRWLEGRIGYGNLRAPYWLLGLEEACGDEEQELRRRFEGGVLEELRHAHLRIFGADNPWFGPKPQLQSTWRRLMLTVLAAQGRHHNKQDLRDYQTRELGTLDGETLLAELFPLPSKNLGTWRYAALPGIPELADRIEYAKVWRDRRVILFRNLVRDHRPVAIVAYGKGRWPAYKEVFQQADWTPWPHGWCETAIVDVHGVRILVALTVHPTAHGLTDASWRALGTWLSEQRVRLGRG